MNAGRSKLARRACRLLVAAALGVGLAVTGAAQDVIDGDSLQLDGKAYRLHGIDAPDETQICPDGWPAGYAAAEYLGELVKDKEITCMPMPGERDGEKMAICRADGVDLGAAMVTGGYAFAFVPFSARYISQEAAAVTARRGVHAHKCPEPWKWRARMGTGR